MRSAPYSALTSSQCRKGGASTFGRDERLERPEKKTKNNNGLWRLHCAFDLPAERFGFIELTDEKGGKAGSTACPSPKAISPSPIGGLCIPILWRIFSGPDSDAIVRAGWKGARWLGKEGKSFDLLAALTAAEGVGYLDTPIWIGRKKAPPLALRLVAFRKPKEAAEAARAKARAAAKREGYAISAGTLTAAEWVILVTSLDAKAFAAAEIGGACYRARFGASSSRLSA